MKATEEALEAKQKPSFELVKVLRIEKEKSYIDMSKRRIFGVLKEVAWVIFDEIHYMKDRAMLGLVFVNQWICLHREMATSGGLHVLLQETKLSTLLLLWDKKGRIIACELKKKCIRHLKDTIKLFSVSNIEMFNEDWLNIDHKM